MQETEILIIGCGIAGLTAALYLADADRQVTVITKTCDTQESNSRYAQGGIIYTSPEDSQEKLVSDTCNAGAGLCLESAVARMAEEGPEAVRELLIERCQIPFTRENGELHLTAEGGHTIRRIIHSEDRTGLSIMEAMVCTARQHKKITFYTDRMAIDLITREHHSDDLMAHYKKPECFGAYVLDNRNRTVETFLARTTILATGGLGQMYRHTTNPNIATGDGYAMAIRAGAILINMEYTQFHPTTLFHPNADSYLISEAVRGEGAVLVTRDSREFMKKYHPMQSLAPRDVVTRAILDEMVLRDDAHVFLDLSAIPSDTILARFPGIHQKLLDFGIDIASQPIPVVPAFHFSCGGVRVNEDSRTNLARLYAVGEVSCTGVHGANRLASTSLLESVVWSRRAARNICEHWSELSGGVYPGIPGWQDKGLQEEFDPALISQDWTSLKNTMWNYVGPIRSGKRLRRAFSSLRRLSSDIEEFYRDTRLTRSIVELRNAVTTGFAIAGAAWRNRRSRGCHFRMDEPELQ